jgi:hypothetical protein
MQVINNYEAGTVRKESKHFTEHGVHPAMPCEIGKSSRGTDRSKNTRLEVK